MTGEPSDHVPRRRPYQAGGRPVRLSVTLTEKERQRLGELAAERGGVRRDAAGQLSAPLPVVPLAGAAVKTASGTVHCDVRRSSGCAGPALAPAKDGSRPRHGLIAAIRLGRGDVRRCKADLTVSAGSYSTIRRWIIAAASMMHVVWLAYSK
jgi:hypothetical protein